MDEKEAVSQRSTTKCCAGVCAGLAEYFGIDPTLVRLAWVVLGFMRRQRPAGLYHRLPS